MRGFIKNLIPEWWDRWCWFALGMIGYSTYWAVFGTRAWTRGFQAGMVAFWVYWLISQAGWWYARECAKIDDEIHAIKDQIILTQQTHINILKRQLSDTDAAYTNYLKEQLK